ncbi:MAG: RNA-binding S4 domain-containing protein [Actinomycetaceae bacterium]|nr:RNA-binding S4 domain-containing protein [Actinomycetaceae bacterium]
MNSIEVTTPIKMAQFLKLANIAESGAHARKLLEDGFIYLNGEQEIRRGKQLHHNDIVTYNDNEARYEFLVVSMNN